MAMRTDHRSDRIRVYLVDDHPVVREGFARALADQEDIVVAGEAETAAQALADVVAAQPDVVLVDLNLPDRDGVELLGALRNVVPRAKLVVLSGCDDEFRVAEALRAGAHGYLLKTASIPEVTEGVRRSAAGGAALSPGIAGVVVRAVRKPSPIGAASLDILTDRERQVLRLLAIGLATREAAKQLSISPKTVETHRVRIYAKLGCKSLVELTRFALRSGLIDA
jgi:two-component system, NarL family, nitrate/nitrite response regulator NarL